MEEMARILRNCNETSLVLVDEIGRGTSTYDGLSLAWACAEYLVEKRAYTLFSTHYFELTQLADSLPLSINVHLDAVEHNQDIVFLYKLKQGAASQSYGIQVAKLAGLPNSVLKNARQRLQLLEQKSDNEFAPASHGIYDDEPVQMSLSASDDLAGGRSTFMVEMEEMARILRNCNETSLVLVDEIGRGTSTYDGLSLAWACAEYLVEKRAYTLFSTHYFELTQLADSLPLSINVHLDAVEHNQDIVFLYKLKQGAASQSYGIQVAKLAGLPNSVLKNARQRLQLLEQNSDNEFAPASHGIYDDEPVQMSL
eukprot:maker-scaffold8_size885657-snap-gene-3.0 protein:Tk09887 transcript:maker-scaffold8_size885657-snap-gene-3.0-mRNA-1 annotation:"dna mismatch repair protein"